MTSYPSVAGALKLSYPPPALGNYRYSASAGLGPPPNSKSKAPDRIANLLAWYRGDAFDAISDGTEVASWTDRSTLRIDATATQGAGSRPTVSRNSINTSLTSVAEAGGGLGGLIRAAPLSSETTWTFYAVVKFTANNCYYYLYGDGLNDGVRMGLDGSSKFLFVVPNSASYTTNETVSTGVFHYIVFVSNIGVRSVYVDGILLTWASTPTTTQTAAASPGFKIFQGVSGGGSLNGNIADCAFYNAAVNDSDRLFNLEIYSKRRYLL